ncbi:MAG TPA: TMEM175 family protein [Rhizomicrobium sp.]
MEPLAPQTPAPSPTARIEAFSDGVIAIIITIMILELKVPFRDFDSGSLMAVLREIAGPLLSYVLSFVVVAILLLNHHEMMRMASDATPALYWWNAHLLFWSSLIPLSTATMGDHPFAPGAVALYGVVLAGVAVSFTLLDRYLMRMAAESCGVRPRAWLDTTRDYAAMALYAAGAALAFVSVYASFVIYVVIPIAYFLSPFRNNRAFVKG